MHRFYPIFLSLFLVNACVFAQEKSRKNDENTKEIFVWPYFHMAGVMDTLRKLPEPEFWSKQNRFGLDVNEVAYENWGTGGSNSISFLLKTQLKRTYERDNVRWQNEFRARYGLNAQKGQKLRKTEDQFEINSTLGFRTSRHSSWYYSAKLSLKSQFDKGYNYPERTHSISSFMAPGYVFAGFGAEYGKDSDKFTLYLSPATLKTTIVADQRLANQGAFGVREALILDDGFILRKGRRSKSEFGVLITNSYEVKVVKNIEFSNRLSLYTDYLRDFGNVDVDWDIGFNFKVNRFVAASLGSHILYDNDTKTTKVNAMGEEERGGAKIQWKQQLGIGVLIAI